MATYQEKVDQHRFQQSAYAAQMADPKLRQIVDTFSGILFNKSLKDLTESEQQHIMQVAAAVQNSVGMVSGGDTFAEVYRGVMASGGIPVTGGSASGRISGAGNSTLAIANQAHGALMKNIRNKEGGLDYGVTSGLDSTTLTQMMARQLKTRAWQQGDVVGMEFGTGAKEFDAKLKELEAAGVSTETEDYKRLVKTKEVLAMREDLRAGTNVSGKNNLMQKLTEEQIDDRVQDSGVKTATNDMAKMQERGLLHGTYLTEKVNKDVISGIKKTAENVRALTEIFETDDFNILQSNATALGMGSLSAAKSATDVKHKITRAKVQAAMTGRSVREVMEEQRDIMDGLSGIYGGDGYAPTNEVERIQRLRSRGAVAVDRKLTNATLDELTEEQGRSTANASNLFQGLQVMDFAISQAGKLSPEQQKMVDKVNKDYATAVKNNDRQAQIAIATYDAMAVADSLSPNAYDPQYQRRARQVNVGNRNLTQDSIKTATFENLEHTMSNRIHRQGDVKGSNVSEWASSTGDTNHDKYKDIMRDVVRGVGGDADHQDALFKRIASMRTMSVTDRMADTAKLRTELKKSGAPEEAIDAQMRVVENLTNTDKVSTKAFDAFTAESKGYLDDATIRQMESPLAAGLAAKESIRIRNEAADQSNQVGEKGMMESFMSGLMGDGGYKREKAAQIGVAYGVSKGKTVTETLGDEGVELGAVNADGLLENREALKKNDKLMQMLGASTDAQKEAAATKLDTAVGTEEIFQQLERGGLMVSKQDKSWFAATDKFVDGSQERLTKLAEKHKITGDAVGVFGKDMIHVSEDGVKFMVDQGDPYTNKKDAYAAVVRQGDQEKMAALRKAARNGDKDAESALQDARKSAMSSLLEASKAVDNDQARNGGFTKQSEFTDQVRKSTENGFSADAVGGFTYRVFGRSDTSQLASRQQALDSNYIDADGKILQGMGKGEDWDSFMEKPGMRDLIQKTKNLTAESGSVERTDGQLTTIISALKAIQDNTKRSGIDKLPN